GGAMVRRLSRVPRRHPGLRRMPRPDRGARAQPARRARLAFRARVEPRGMDAAGAPRRLRVAADGDHGDDLRPPAHRVRARHARAITARVVPGLRATDHGYADDGRVARHRARVTVAYADHPRAS